MNTPAPSLVSVTEMRRDHPDTWARVRGACQWAGRGVDLDEHAAQIVALVIRARGDKPHPRKKQARRGDVGRATSTGSPKKGA